MSTISTAINENTEFDCSLSSTLSSCLNPEKVIKTRRKEYFDPLFGQKLPKIVIKDKSLKPKRELTREEK
jgi:hypothetical protein